MTDGKKAETVDREAIDSSLHNQAQALHSAKEGRDLAAEKYEDKAASDLEDARESYQKGDNDG